MSLTSSLQRIVQAKADIKTAIENKGVTVGNDVSIANYDDYIDAIQTGSSTPTQTKTVALSMASGDQVITPDTGYALSQVTVEKPSTLIASNIKDGVSIGGVTGSYTASPTLTTKTITANGTYDASDDSADGYSSVTVNVSGGGGGGSNLDDIIDGTLTSFTMPSGKTTIWKYRFTNMSSLTSCDLTGCTSIGEYAFMGCSGLSSLTIPTTITNIGSYAFYYDSTSMTLKPTNTCTIGTSAFEAATQLTEIDGKLGNIGDNAFSGCSNLTKIHAKVSGSVGTLAFGATTKVNDVDFSGSNITSIGETAFQRIGLNRSSPTSNWLTFDFRTSTFTTVPRYLFSASTSSSIYARNFRLFLPSTVTTISGYAFRWNRYFNVYFNTSTPPTTINSNAWSNTTSYTPKIFVPYNNINAYKTTTNLSSMLSYIYGWAEENTFTLGATLPSTNDENLTLTWYSDENLTNQVTTVSDPTQIYYCTAA